MSQYINNLTFVIPSNALYSETDTTISLPGLGALLAEITLFPSVLSYEYFGATGNVISREILNITAVNSTAETITVTRAAEKVRIKDSVYTYTQTPVKLLPGGVLQQKVTAETLNASVGASGSSLQIASNLSDLANTGTARTNLDVYSKGEVDSSKVGLTGNETVAGVKTFSSNSIFNGNVGIGESSPQTPLHISAAGDNFVRIISGDSNSSGINLGDQSDNFRANIRYDHSAEDMIFRVSSADTVTFKGSGNVLIGTTTESGAKLDVAGTARVNTLIADTGGVGFETTISANQILFDRSGSNYIYASGANGEIRFGVGGDNPNGSTTPILHLDNTQSVGIGIVANSAYKLYVGGTSRITGDSQFDDQVSMGENVGGSNARLAVQQGGTVGSHELIQLKSWNGSANKGVVFEVDNTEGSSVLNINTYQSSGGVPSLAFSTGGTERARIYEDGRFLIGTTSLSRSEILRVMGAAGNIGHLHSTTGLFSDDAMLSFQYDRARIGHDGTREALLLEAGTSKPMVFDVDGAERMRIVQTTGNVGIGTTSPEGLLNLKKDGAYGDVKLIIESDSDNTIETANPSVELRQDGGGVRGFFGISGNPNESFSGQIENCLYIETKDSGTAGDIQFATGATNSTSTDGVGRMTIKRNGNILMGKSTDAANAVLQLEGNASISEEIQLSDMTAPGTTTNKLYAVSGDLYWNGTQINGGGGSGFTSVFTDNGGGSFTHSDGNATSVTFDVGVESDTTTATGSDAVTNMVSLTQAEYDAATKNANTIYIVTDTPAIYHGSVLIGQPAGPSTLDTSSATYTGNLFNVGNNPQGVHITDDFGTAYFANATGEAIQSRNFGTAGDVSTLGAVTNTLTVAGAGGGIVNVRDLAFNGDRSKLYVLGLNGVNARIDQFNLGTNGDLSTAVYTATTGNITSAANAKSLYISDDEANAFIQFENGGTAPIHQYTIGTPGTISTLNTTSVGSLDVEPQDSLTNAMFMTGTQIFTSGLTNSTLHEYSWDGSVITSGSFVQAGLDHSGELSLANGIHVTNSKLYLVASAGIYEYNM